MTHTHTHTHTPGHLYCMHHSILVKKATHSSRVQNFSSYYYIHLQFELNSSVFAAKQSHIAELLC